MSRQKEVDPSRPSPFDWGPFHFEWEPRSCWWVCRISAVERDVSPDIDRFVSDTMALLWQEEDGWEAMIFGAPGKGPTAQKALDTALVGARQELERRLGMLRVVSARPGRRFP